MLYPIVRPLAAIAIKSFFDKIYLNNMDRVPKGKPVMLVANHPTTFIEPCILACFMDRPLYYLVRGDFFKNPLFSALLKDLHMIPIFRMKDGGYGSLKNNYQSFSACQEWLSQNKTVMVLAEGSAVYEKRLRPLRKGAARIALSTLDRYPDLELYIVPVGVNFTDSNRFGSQAMINFAEPFLAKDYIEHFREHEAKAIKSFTQRLKQGLEPNIVIISEEKDDWLVNTLLDMQRNDHPVGKIPVIAADLTPYQREKHLADRINDLPQAEKDQLKADCKDYDRQLRDAQLEDEIIAQPEQFRAINPVVGWLGSIPAALGLLLNALPLLLIKYIVNNKVVYNEFFGSVRIAATLGSFLIYYLLLLLFLPLFFGWNGFLSWFAFPVLGYITLAYYPFFKKWRLKKQYRKTPQALLEALVRQRKEIMGKVEALEAVS